MNSQAELQMLPPFVENFLKRYHIEYGPADSKSARREETKHTSTLEKSIETLIQARTYHKISQIYKQFIAVTLTAPVMLQHDYQQFIYPFFVHLALQLYQLQKDNDAKSFIKEFRHYQPPQCQPMIDQLLEQKNKFKPPHFNIQMNQFALDDLMLSIENKKQVLLSFIITTHINITVAPFSHDLLFIDMEQTAEASPDKLPILTPIPPEETEQPPLSVKFHPDDLNKQPSIKQTEKGLYLTQALPDVAHIIAYNHNNRISDMHVSPCARLLSMAQDSSVVISSLDSTTGVNNSNSATLINHAGKVLTTDFSSDSQYIVSGGMDNQIKVAHLEAFRPLARFKNHLEPILSVAWDNRSAFFAGASQDRTTSMWSLQSPTILRLFVGHTLPVSKVIFSKDNRSIITCSNDLTTRVWDIGTANEIAKFHCGRSIPLAIDVDPGNQLIVCGCENGTVMLWDANQGKRLWSAKPFEERVTDVKFSSDASLLIGSCIDGSLVAFNLKNENGDIVMRTQAYASTIDSISITKQNLVCTTGRSLKGAIQI